MRKKLLHFGIDPGKMNTGLCMIKNTKKCPIVLEYGKLETSVTSVNGLDTVIPDYVAVYSELHQWIDRYGAENISSITVERFAARGQFASNMAEYVWVVISAAMALAGTYGFRFHFILPSTWKKNVEKQLSTGKKLQRLYSGVRVDCRHVVDAQHLALYTMVESGVTTWDAVSLMDYSDTLEAFQCSVAQATRKLSTKASAR